MLNKERYRLVEGYPVYEIKQMTLGFDKAYILTDNKRIMELDACNEAVNV